MRPDSKVFCCFLVKTTKYCVYLGVLRGTQGFVEKTKKHFYENRNENGAQDVKSIILIIFLLSLHHLKIRLFYISKRCSFANDHQQLTVFPLPGQTQL